MGRGTRDFTYYVVKGLHGAADVNGDGVVSADELGEYVQPTCGRLPTNGRQNPTAERGSSTEHDPGLQPDAGQRASELQAPKFGALIIQANIGWHGDLGGRHQPGLGG